MKQLTTTDIKRKHAGAKRGRKPKQPKPEKVAENAFHEATRYRPIVRQLFALLKPPYPVTIVYEGGDYRLTRDLDQYHGQKLNRLVGVCDQTTTMADVDAMVP
jgi:hypothetical protein